ncbi:MAG: GGDEF domain-containing protein [Pusillimonas sp.]
MTDASTPGAALRTGNTIDSATEPPITAAMQADFDAVLRGRILSSQFQPIVDLATGGILGYEGLIRGPAGTPLYEPTVLFNVARSCGKTIQLESLCLRLHIQQFHKLGLSGKLFLNMGAEVLAMSARATGVLPLLGHPDGFSPDDLVLEMTEAQAVPSYVQLRQAVTEHRTLGSRIALDDLGEGYSGLRLWAELRPEYVKIDKYFIQGIEQDSLKRQFVRSICETAKKSGARVIAEGIETVQELNWVRSLGIRYGQGFFLAHPALPPVSVLPPEILSALALPVPGNKLLVNGARRSAPTARSILRTVPAVECTVPTTDVYNIFGAQNDLQLVAVLRDGAPVGLIPRARLLERLARPFYRELYGHKPCASFVESRPLTVDHQTSLHDLGHLISEATSNHLYDGFIITEQGRYLGVGTGFDLIREITKMQIDAAKYANPLTQLPGGVPINEHIDELLKNEVSFAVCYADLDHFKPFNDLYSYRKGDAIIQTAASLLREHIDREVDFLGHIGGDDFIVVFRSPDWRDRCQRILDRFARETVIFYRPEHISAGGYTTENRQGVRVFHPLVSLSMGVVHINTVLPYNSYQIAEFAALAKSEAKKIPGNSLFVERRSLMPENGPS